MEREKQLTDKEVETLLGQITNWQRPPESKSYCNEFYCKGNKNGLVAEIAGVDSHYYSVAVLNDGHLVFGNDRGKEGYTGWQVYGDLYTKARGILKGLGKTIAEKKEKDLKTALAKTRAIIARGK